MKSKTIMIATLGLALMLLTFSGSYTQALGAAAQFNSTNTNGVGSLFTEEMKVVAGIETSALVTVTAIGGPSSLEVTPASLMDGVVNWIFAASDQSNYRDYLYRRPFRAPDNATLVLEMDKSLGSESSLNSALAVAEAFSNYYELQLFWSGAVTSPSGNYVYKFSGGMDNSLVTTMVTDIQADITSGFMTAFTPSEVVNSPVKAVFIGEAVGVGAVRGVYYVNPTAIQNDSGVYTLSTQNLFGKTVTTFNDPSYDKISIVKFRFPYTINPLSISPDTDNIAPQITGKMDWVMQVPWHVRMTSGDFVVTFNINYADLASAPRVLVNMGYDQDLLNTQGILQMDYNVTNTGTETAKNITISYPLGRDFMKFYSHLPTIWRLRDGISINESIRLPVDISIVVTVNGNPEYEYNQTMMIMEGWYIYDDNGSLVDIDPSTTEAVVHSESQTVGYGSLSYTVSTEVKLNSSQGLSEILINRATEFLNNVSISDYGTDFSALLDANKEQLKDGIQAAADDLFHELYQNQTIFDFDAMDFEIVSREIQTSSGGNVTQYFLETTIDSLDAGSSTIVSWKLYNIPNENWLLGSMYIHGIDVGDGKMAVGLTTKQHDFYEMMRVILGFSDKAGQVSYGRPISFYDYADKIWISAGARFSFKDPEGFEYFGFSNGINFQIADDEAILNVHVDLDSIAYHVGDNITINGYIENTGNLPAEDVTLYLFHGSLNRNWQIKNPDLFYKEDVGTIANGTRYNFTVEVEANTFLGIHPVYAVVEFTSDKGQGPAKVVNPFTNQVGYFEGAAEAHEIVISNMAWALLLPKTAAMKPAFPQPILDIDANVNIIIPDNAPWELEITLTITNVGESSTHITVNQYYNMSQLELLSKSTTMGSISNTTFLGMGLISVQGITLDPSDSVVITMHWKFLTSQGCYLPGAQVLYDSRFENELGGSGSGGGTGTFASLDGSSQDADNWEDYGASTSTGSSAGADIFTGGNTKTRRIGSLDLVYLSATAILLASIMTIVRKKRRF